MKCLVDGCAKNGRRRRGWCDIHYKRWLRYGNPLTTKHHGHAGKQPSPEYISWRAMIQRCYYPQHPAYERYFGRGITVIERWMQFENFLADMGLKPTPKHTIERINNKDGYYPENCKWETMTAQQGNKRSNRLLTLDGITRNLTEWSKQSNIRMTTINERLKRGWSVKDALTKPTR